MWWRERPVISGLKMRREKSFVCYRKIMDTCLITINRSPEEIYEFFHISKKTFKMTTGNLYKQHKILFTKTGIQAR